MICKKTLQDKIYNYSFVENGLVKLDNHEEEIVIPYEEWKENYYVVDKWSKI